MADVGQHFAVSRLLERLSRRNMPKNEVEAAVRESQQLKARDLRHSTTEWSDRLAAKIVGKPRQEGGAELIEEYRGKLLAAVDIYRQPGAQNAEEVVEAVERLIDVVHAASQSGQ